MGRSTRLDRTLGLAGLCLVLAGCPSSGLNFGADDGNNDNIIQTTTGHAPGGALTGSAGSSSSGTTPSGSGTSSETSGVPLTCEAIANGTGTLSDPSTGQNLTSLSLGCSLNVLPLYLDNGDFSCSITSAHTVLSAVTSIHRQGTETVQAAWTGGAAYSGFQTQALTSVAGPTPQERAERALEARAKALKPTIPTSTYRTQAGTTVSLGNTRTFQMVNVNYDSSKPQSGTNVPTFSVQGDAVFVNPPSANGTGGFVIWVDDQDKAGFAPGSTLVNSIAAQLRDHIYPTDTRYFGVDTMTADNNAEPASKRIVLNDDYVHFVFSHEVDQNSLSTQHSGVFGFFYIGDLLAFDSFSNSTSNQSKVLYIAADAATFSPNDMYATIAHEFQHLLFSCHRVKAVGLSNHLAEYNSGYLAWINEGLSMVAMFLNGFGPDAGSQSSPAIVTQIGDFLSQADQYSMTDFFRSSGNPQDAYGMVSLFCGYMHDRLGDGILQDIHNLDDSATMYDGAPASVGSVDPTDLVDRALRLHGSSLNQLFPDFAAALALDGDAALGGLSADEAKRFEIQNVNLRGHYTGLNGTSVSLQGPVVNAASSTTLSLRPYSVHFLARSAQSSSVSLKFSNHTASSGANYGTKLIVE